MCALGNRRLLAESRASSLAEFAISLPLLVVLVVGIFDFGAAFNTKQELNNAVREGARLGASLPTNDLSNTAGAPPTVEAVRYLVDSYLVASRINDCGLGGSPAVSNPSTLKWVYTTPCFGSTNLTLTVIRGFPSCSLQANTYGNPNPINAYIPCTQVSIQYPYQWRFNSVIQLLVPGANYGPFLNISTDATATNVD